MKLHNWSLRAGTLLVTGLMTQSVLAQQRETRPNREAQADTARPTEAVAARRAAANARFLVGDVDGALDELNDVGEPRVSEVKIEGRVRAKSDVLHDYVGIGPGDMLTPGRLSRLNRRMADLPVASSGSARYDLTTGSVVVRPVLFERDRFYASPADWAPVGARALFTQELRMTVSDATGRGDVWTPSFRWAQGRPRVALQVAMPAPSWLPGVLTVDTFWQSQRYVRRVEGGADSIIDQDRVRAGVMLSDWLTGWLRWEGGAGIERIAAANYASFNGSVNVRTFGDRLATNVSGTWFGSGRQQSTSTGELTVMMRSTIHDDEPLLTGLAGVAVAADNAPLFLWPAASSGAEQVAQLRAHRLHQDGIVTGVFGRQLVFGSVEYVHPISTRFGPSFLGVAGFSDVAQAHRTLDATGGNVQVDIGTGIRVATSRSGGRFRLDFGYGLQDGRVRVSAGYVQPWGRR
jgi:hypothetical protein